MSLRYFLAVFFVWSISVTPSFGQLIADFNFEEDGSLTTNEAGVDAISINEYARSKNGGVYMDKSQIPPGDGDQDINLILPEEVLKNTESIYLEFDFQCEDDFGWLIFAGEQKHFGIAHISTIGFRVRYYTKANPGKEIDSWDSEYSNPGEEFTPLHPGERAIITFIYDKEEGTAYLLKDNKEIWSTPEEQRTPGYALHWFTEEGHFSIGSHMGEGESEEPHLYYFRAYEEPCVEFEELTVEADTICGSGSAVLSAFSNNDDVRYRWYKELTSEEPLAESENNLFTTPEINETTDFYVAQGIGPCESERIKVTAYVDPLPAAPKGEAASRCGPGKLTLTASGGSEGSYRWYKDSSSDTPIPGAVNSSFETDLLSSSGLYYVSIIGENDCESKKTSIEAIIHPKPEAPLAQELSRCGPGVMDIQILQKEALQGSGFRIYQQKEHGNPVYEQEGDQFQLKVTRDTVLYVSVTNQHCESEREAIKVTMLPLPVLDAGKDISILKGESVKLHATGNFSSVRWKPTPSMDFPNSTGPTVTPEVSTNYIVTAVNENGCEESDTLSVFVQDKYPVPNVFSPNNDGVNDFWEIPNIEQYPESKLLIFNRWGNQVFSSEGYLEPWDGTFNGQKLPAGTYYYTLQLSPDSELVKGSIFLMN